MSHTLDYVRARRYRRLALVEKDPAIVALLNQLAREAELGILFTSDRRWRASSPHRLTQSGDHPEGPSKSGYHKESSFRW